jgi:gliding motility-associated-like protein
MNTFLKIAFSYLALNIFLMDPLFAQNYQYSRKYRVTAYKNGNSQITSVSNIAEVVPTMSLYVPDAFTPNGDGINDTFGISGEAVKTFDMRIYDRWGELLFESENASTQWDGNYKGKKVPQGVYVYQLSAQAISGEHAARKGTVTVVD